MVFDGLNTLTPALNDFASLVGIYVAAQHLLKEYIALSSHLPLPPDQDSSVGSTTNEDGSIRTPRWRRLGLGLGGISRWITGQPLAMRYLAFSQSISILTFAISCIRSQRIVDTIWTGIMLAAMIYCFKTASVVLLPDRIALSLKRRHSTSTYVPRITYVSPPPKRSSGFRWTLAVGLATATLRATQGGFQILLPLFAATVVLTHLVMLKKLSGAIAPVVAGMMIFVTFIITITLIVARISRPLPAIKPFVPDPKVRVSAWISGVMLTAATTMPVIFYGLFMVTTLRFEYSLNYPPSRGSVSPVPVPSTIPPFPKPIFHSSMVSAAVSLVFTNHIMQPYLPASMEKYMGAIGFACTVPLVAGATALAAWYQGRLSQWWKYEETWTLTCDEVIALRDSSKHEKTDPLTV